MEETAIIEQIKFYVQQKFEKEGTGHDWFHIERVYKTAIEIAREENANLFIVQLAALLHDIADHKFHNGDLNIGPDTAEKIMKTFGLAPDLIKDVKTIVQEISFKGANNDYPMSTAEGAIVRDADRLDAIGAIGIARAFAYGGSKHRLLYHPEEKRTLHDDFEHYYKDESSTINHFYAKLLLLKDRMTTPTAKKIAEHRHEFMVQFLDEFYQEWNGER